MTTDLIVISGTDLPVTLQELKDHCRVYDYASEDTMLTTYLKAAIRITEQLLGWSLYSNVCKLTTDNYDKVEFRFQPVLSLTTVTHHLQGVDTVLANTDYTLTQRNGVFSFQIADEFRNENADLTELAIEYQAGYTPTAIPDHWKTAILLIAGDLYAAREDKPSSRVLSAAERILQIDRRSII